MSASLATRRSPSWFRIHTRGEAAAWPGSQRLARYFTRAPISEDRLTERDDGRLELRLKRAWRDGTTALVFTPHELL